MKNKRDMLVLKQSRKAFQREKCKVEVIIFVVGMLLIAAYTINTNDGLLRDGYYIRPQYGENSETLQITAGIYDQVFEVDVGARELSSDEATRLYEDLTESLPESIKGENVSLDEVRNNLVLPSAIDGFPFKIEWSSEKEEIIDETGVIQAVGLEENTVVVLEANVHFKEYEWVYQIPIQVLSQELSAQEQYYIELKDYLEECEEQKKEQAKWELPILFDEIPINVKETTDNKILPMSLLLIVTMVCYWFAHDQELRKRKDERRKVFIHYYEGIVSKISMYVTAGLTMQGAVRQCMEEYCKEGISIWIKESFNNLNKELHNGTSFYTALELWATSCDYHEYDKLVSILRQGERNDTAGISFLLMEEAREARRAKLGETKVRGNQISTKLLGPMMLQLGVVMALIMIPAFMSFQM